VADKRISSTGARTSGSISGLGAPIPANVPPILRRFWDYTKQKAKEFAKHFANPEDYEEKFVEAVRRDAKHWGA